MNWQEYLEFYFNKYRYNFNVQKFAKFPGPWLNYKTKEYENFIKTEKFVNHREVFFDEVVFDIDMKKDLTKQVAVAESQKIAEVLSERLKKYDYSHSVWTSGGSGTHLHIVFPELIKYNNLENKIMKKVILRLIAHDYIRPREGFGKVQLQTNTLIQLENAPHRKGGKKTLLWEHNTNQPNRLKPFFIKEFQEELAKNNLMKRYFKEYDTKNKPEAITFLENEQFYDVDDGRDRALFILTAFYKQFLSQEELLKKMMDWNKRILKGYFSEQVIKAKVRSARPCLPLNYLIELFDDLGLDQRYIKSLKNKNNLYKK